MTVLAWYGLICNALRDLVPFIQFKKREKKKHGGVSRFLNCANGAKSSNGSQL